MLFQFAAQQLRILHGTARHERRAEAGAESGNGFGDSAFSAGHLGRVARQEVVHRLGVVQPAYRWQYTEGVGSQEHHVSGVASVPALAGIRNEFDWIGSPCVFGLAPVIKVDVPAAGSKAHVLKQCAEAPGNGKNVGLGLGVKPDYLGVATTLEIEYTFLRPAVLVVAYERTGRVRGKGGLAGAAEAEKQRGVAVRTFVCRAVHRHYAACRQFEIHRGENTLFDFACVFGVGNQDQAFAEVKHNGRVSAYPMPLRICLEPRQVQHGPAVSVTGDRTVTDEHRAGKQAVPGVLGIDPDRELKAVILADMQILPVQFAPLDPGEHVLFENLKKIRCDRLVDFAPVDGLFCQGIAHHELVAGRAARELTGVYNQGAVFRKQAFTLKRRFIKLGRGGVNGQVAQLDFQAGRFVALLHRCRALRSVVGFMLPAPGNTKPELLLVPGQIESRFQGRARIDFIEYAKTQLRNRAEHR